MAVTKAKPKSKVVGKKEIVDQVAGKVSGMTKKDAEKFINAMTEAITESLSKGHTVRLIPFGNFMVRDRASRTGRNPRTGAKIKIEARKIPAFRPGKELRDAVK
ncbi:MAG: HU family DNA-binding protein [Candidatus Eremiobacterota bacterium]